MQTPHKTTHASHMQFDEFGQTHTPVILSPQSGNKQVHHLPKSPWAPLGVCKCVVRILNMTSTLLLDC